MIKNRRFLLLIIFFSLLTAFLSAQETPEPEIQTAEETETETVTETEEDDTAVKLTPEQKRIEMEIKISSLPELAALCRTLGLSESGTREELTSRLREHYGLSEITHTPNDQKVITVDSAQSTEYFKIETTDEEYARLKGNVKLSMKDGGNIHTISAQEILFNRTRNTMTARGKVEYIKTTESDGTIETFRGENITVNIDDWSCTFLDGSSERRMSGEEDAYRFSGTVLSRTGDDATILSKATITNANTEEPYWSISASKIWLLPGADFALFNAWLKVGELPMLYIPVLFYPVDEMIFHPVFGFRSREGAFVQTTTYLLGRPRTDENSQNSITKILGGSTDMEVERQGLFLKSTGKKYVSVTEPNLRLLVDHYVNMGTYAGLEFMLPNRGIISSPLDFNFGLGYTRTITSAGGFNPYEPTKYDGEFDWNHTNFFSYDFPFRYKMQFKSAVGFRYGNISWDFPYYSDPFVHRDFTEFRAESMDWFALMEEGLETESSTTSWGSPQWLINSSFNPNVSFLNPAVTRISISNLSTTLTFVGIDDNRRDETTNAFIINPESPVKRFFAPNIYTIFNISGSIAGNPLTIGNRRQTGTSSSQTTETRNPLEGIGTPIPPWEDEKDTAKKIESDEILVLPALNQKFALTTGNMIYDIDYNIAPASSAELQFMSQPTNWPSAEDVNWNDIQSVLTSVSGNSSINFKVNHSSGLFANTITFSGLGTWRDYYFLNEEAPPFLKNPNASDEEKESDPDKVLAERKKQYAHTRYSTAYTYNGTVRPLLNDPIFGQSNLNYTFNGTMVTSKRYDPEGENSDSPELTPVWGKWVKEDVSKEIYGLRSHSFATNLSANIISNVQDVSFRYDLPPLESQIAVNATFRVWISETNINFRIRQLPEDFVPTPTITKGPGEWWYEPINITETLKLPYNNLFNLNMIIKPEEDYDVTNINSTLTLFDSSLKTSFSALKTQKSEFDREESKWVDYGEEVLQPKDLSILFNKDFKERFIIINSLSYGLNLNTSLTYDLIRHTNSNFTFGLGSKFRVNKIMDISLMASAKNTVIFRYFKGIDSMDHLTFMYPDGPQNNVVTDLIDSFNFFDEMKRKRTGFKMGKFDIDITHYLGDWEAKLKVEMYPHENRTEVIPKYEVTTDISFLVQWKPISEIKTDVTYDGKLDKWSIK